MQVPSFVLMGIPHSASLSALSPFGEACSRMDLTAIHEILETVGFKDDEGVANEVLYIFQIIRNHYVGPTPVTCVAMLSSYGQSY